MMRGFGEGGLGIAVAKAAVADEVAASLVVQHRRIGFEARQGIDDAWQRPVFDLDGVQPVLGEVAVAATTMATGSPT